jgi:hypothetical protein
MCGMRGDLGLENFCCGHHLCSTSFLENGSPSDNGLPFLFQVSLKRLLAAVAACCRSSLIRAAMTTGAGRSLVRAAMTASARSRLIRAAVAAGAGCGIVGGLGLENFCLNNHFNHLVY